MTAPLPEPQAAFEQLQPRLAALKPEALQPPRADVRPLVAAARALAHEADALKARLTRLPREEFEPALLAELPLAAQAILHARARLDAALRPPAEPHLPDELTQRAAVLKERMVRVLRYHFEEDEGVGVALAALGRKRTSQGELAADLRRLAALYRERAAALATDTRHYRADDALVAEDTAGEIGAILSAVGADAIRDATGALARVQALLVGAYDQVRAAVLFLLRADAGAAERFPTLAALPAPRGRPKKSAPPPSAPPNGAAHEEPSAEP